MEIKNDGNEYVRKCLAENPALYIDDPIVDSAGLIETKEELLMLKKYFVKVITRNKIELTLTQQEFDYFTELLNNKEVVKREQNG